MRNFVIVGLTGTTGAGKSTVSDFFKEIGYTVIDADIIARQAMLPNGGCLKQVCAAFGYDILNSDGTLNRQVLADKAFSSKEKTQLLNDITHPWIFLQVLKACRDNINSNNRRILFDAPLLFESNSDIMCDFVVSVCAPTELRLKRLEKRDGLSRQQLEKRMAAQHENEFYTSKSDFVIDGSLDLNRVKEMVGCIAENVERACGLSARR